jgi:proton glutamate symport protein
VFLLVVFGSVLAGTATAGSSGVSLLTMLGIVSGPLGLPLDAVLILFVVIDPIIAPFRVLAIVHSSCALITIIFPKKTYDLAKNKR